MSIQANGDSKRSIKTVTFEIGILISMFSVGMGAAYGYGMLNNRVCELEEKTRSIVQMREDIAVTKAMVSSIFHQMEGKK